MAESSGRDPKWLKPLWEKKKVDTARRVERAVKELLKHKEPVTLNTIRNSVDALFGISIFGKHDSAKRERIRPLSEAPHGASIDEAAESGALRSAAETPAGKGSKSAGEDQPPAT